MTPLVLTNYSYLNAMTGSTLVARYAGRKDASKATTVNNSATEKNVSGSDGLTANGQFLIKCHLADHCSFPNLCQDEACLTVL